MPVSPRLLVGLLITAASLAALPARAQQAPDNFRWIDFHSDKEADTIVWVTRTLAAERWTGLREIGVEYDAALVVTTDRATPQSSPDADTFSVWSISLTSHALTPLIKGVNLRLLDWMKFSDSGQGEIGALYDDSAGAQPATFFTAFHYDVSQHAWAARWIRGGQAAPVFSPNSTPGLTLTQIYAVLAESSGRQLLSTWSHFDYGAQKPAEDYLYLYELDPFSGLERIAQVNGKQADDMKQRLCRAQETATAVAHGQDSPLCQALVKPRVERKPVTTPPANNRGQSSPPGYRRPAPPPATQPRP